MTATQIAQYRIVAPLGKGGMGEVFRARDLRLGREVALKILPAPYAADPKRRLRFEREAQAASALSHPNIATIYEAGVDNGVPYMAMELIEGERLRDLMSAPLSARRVRELGSQMAAGLAKAHEAGIVHRDLKPENIMLSRDGFVKILDFGLAKFTPAAAEDDATMSITQRGVLMGTVPYMSPEQACGREIDVRSDQFSLGTILYEMITGRHPFRRGSGAETLVAIIDRPPDPLDASVSPPLAAVIRQCLEKDPARRYESTRELAAAFQAPIESRAPVAKLRWMAAGLALIAAAGGGFGWWRSQTSAQALEARRLVAIRPFKNISSDAAQSYMVDGVTEEIRDQLSRTASLRLLSSGAVSRYRDGEIRKLAVETGAGSVVEGSVRINDGRVRVQASLVDARTELLLWSDSFERKIGDVFTMQREVARRIAGALGTQLTGKERERPTDNLEAYDLFSRARQLRGRPADTERAMELLRQAIQLDPEFAEAMAALSLRNLYRVVYAGTGQTEEAIRWAQKAISIDPQSVNAYYALAGNYGLLGRVASSRGALLKGLELDPNCTRCMNDLGNIEVDSGRFDEAIRWTRKSLLLAPNITAPYYHVALALYNYGASDLTQTFLDLYAKRFPHLPPLEFQVALYLDLGKADQAMNLARERFKKMPNAFTEFMLENTAYLARSPEAEKLTETFFHKSPDPRFAQWPLVSESVRTRYACLLLKRGERVRALALLQDSEKVIRKMIADGLDTAYPFEELAAIHALRGETSAALEAYEKAYSMGWRLVSLTRLNPAFDGIRQEPAFQSLVNRMSADLERMRVSSKELPEFRDRTLPYLRSLPSPVTR